MNGERRLGQALRNRARPAAQGWLPRLSRRWRGSLQLRVVTTTLVLSAAVVTLLGFFLIEQIQQNLIKTKEASAANVANEGLLLALSHNGASQPLGAASRAVMNGIVTELESVGSGSGLDYAVAVVPNVSGPPVYGSGSENGFAPGFTIPHGLQNEVLSHHSGHMWFMPSQMRLQGSSVPVTGLAYGAQFGRAYQLYYFFPLTTEEQNLAQAQRTLLLVGLGTVALLAAIAWLVTRWVVAPVRLAAQGALRLSAGHLDQRMPTRGADELAALGTAFNQMAASLQDKIGELEDLSHVQRRFVSDVSHELRTPLTTIRMAADILYASRDEFDPSSARSAELLQSQLERFESLLTDLLEISRFDANVATLDAEPVDICDVTRNSADDAQHLAERRGAKIEFRLPAVPCVAEADRRRVERILRNLLYNAVEHGEGKDVIVTVGADSDAVAVLVRDFGIGLGSGEEQQVFDRFWRADPARARGSGGTGLGLSIALEDAHLHGGWLHAWGEPGRGSAFRLTLPRVAGGQLVGSPLPLAPDGVTALAPTGKPARSAKGLPAKRPKPARSAAASPTEPQAVRSGPDGQAAQPQDTEAARHV